MRNIKYIVIHCSGAPQSQTPQVIIDYHTKVLKWSRPGYHYIIDRFGNVVNAWPEESYSNGVKIQGHSYNSVSVNICYIGGVDINGKPFDNRTQAQKDALLALLRKLRAKYPDAVILGHRDLSNDLNGNGVLEPHEWIKPCPCFDAKTEYAGL